ncbi:MAG: hypothetical protein IPI58_05100 [Alphaproteobacteria bacterium]|nr:MAG: hypothetical protein IPI58_05100 [Alphaproteobacteria bacterium]
MTQDDRHQHTFEQATEWLIRVFGPAIMFESQLSRMRASAGKDVDPCAWKMDSYGDLDLDIDLPPMIVEHFVEHLRHHLGEAMIEKIVPIHWKKDGRANLRALRRSDWPMPKDVIESNLSIRAAALKDVAERSPKRAEWIDGIVHDLLAHEAAWMTRKRSVEGKCNRLFLGREDPSERVLPSGFRYGVALGKWPDLELVLPLGSYLPPFPDHGPGSDVPWSQRNHDLGLGGFMAYDDYNSGGMGPTMESRLRVPGICDADIANRLEEFLEVPEKCAAVRQYIHEVIAATCTMNWFQLNLHPDFYHEQRLIFDQIPQDLPVKEQLARRKEQTRKLWDKEEYVKWREIFPRLAGANPTMGQLVLAVHAKPPLGQEDVYARLGLWFKGAFPLLEKHLNANPKAVRPNQSHEQRASDTPRI